MRKRLIQHPRFVKLSNTVCAWRSSKTNWNANRCFIPRIYKRVWLSRNDRCAISLAYGTFTTDFKPSYSFGGAFLIMEGLYRASLEDEYAGFYPNLPNDGFGSLIVEVPYHIAKGSIKTFDKICHRAWSGKRKAE